MQNHNTYVFWVASAPVCLNSSDFFILDIPTCNVTGDQPASLEQWEQSLIILFEVFIAT